MAYTYGYQNPYQAPYQPQYGNPYQNQVQPQQPAQQPIQAAQGLSGASRPVTNKSEAMGVPADFTGALMVFPDLTNNRVYLKRWNMQTGAAEFGEFVPAPAQAEENNNQGNVWATLQDFQNLQDIVNNLQKEIDRLKKPNNGKAVKKNDANESDE